MGRDTSGVRGMDVGGKDNEVIAMDVARDDMDLLVVTEDGYGKRTKIDQYRKTSRGAKGVKTIRLTEAKGGLAGALVVRAHQELVFISQNGMVQRTGVRGISQQGRVGDRRAGDEPAATATACRRSRWSSSPTRRTAPRPSTRHRSERDERRRGAPAQVSPRPARTAMPRTARTLRRPERPDAGRTAGCPSGADCYSGLTRERRWSVRSTVLVGPWR